MNHQVKILTKANLNHNVVQLRLEKPEGYAFSAGQAIELMVDAPEKKGPGPFTFTSLSSTPYLELTIKIYRERNGLTSAIGNKKAGDSVLITDPWDSFLNKGPGVFIAGGAGVTPFIALLRQLKVDQNIGSSYLLFSNKTKEDIFLEDELRGMLGERYINILTQDPETSFAGRIDAPFLKSHINNFKQPFYVCGPPGFVDTVQSDIARLGVELDMVNVSF